MYELTTEYETYAAELETGMALREEVPSMLSEVLLEILEAETYDKIRRKNWRSIIKDLQTPARINYAKSLARDVARRKHFGKPERFQPSGVEVHHWIPFKYAHLFPDYNLSRLNRLTVPIDATTHKLIGAAVDQAAGRQPDRQKIEAVLDKLAKGNWRSGDIRLNPSYFRSVSDKRLLPSPDLSRNKQIGMIRQIGAFKTAFGLPKEFENLSFY